MIPLASSVHLFAALFGSKTGNIALPGKSGGSPSLPIQSALREHGLLWGSLVASQNGWCPVERMVPGDMVLTFDHGMQRIVENRTLVIRRADVPSCKAYTMFIPCGALGNRKDMHIMPMQEVIVESDRAEEMYGDPFVLTPCLLLQGHKGIRPEPMDHDLRLSMLIFETEQIVHTNGGTLMLAQMESCSSPLSQAAADENCIYPRLSKDQILQVIDRDESEQMPYAAFAAQSIDETYATIEARLA